jgi:lysophospholipase L1-like esterase|tara:strand:- start:3274 stop:3822 length:549 start_codon:yes stop_codon:yes gene_type:complete
MIWNEILCIGDSLTYGARDPYKRCYPAELGRMMAEETNEFYYCHNFGINGETSSDLQKRAWGNVSSRSNSKIMILLIGTNDTQIEMPKSIYEDNIRQIISIGRVFDMKVIVGNIPDLGFTPLYLSSSYIDEYNLVIKRLSKEMKFDTVDLSGIEMIDGCHFTHDGNIEVAKRFKKCILGLQR